MKKTTLVILTVLLVAYGVFLRDRHWHQEAEQAKVFCESMIPMIERHHAEHGTYPAQPDPTWLAGREIPKLVDVDTFYLRRQAGSLLRYQNPAEFWNDVFGYHGSPDGGSWVQYDGY